MKFLGSLVLAASLASALPKRTTTSGALYFLDSDPEGASVVSLKIGHDGSLGKPQRTSTGGKGLIGNNQMGPVTQDPLFSQDSIIVSGNHLFTVNAGSNTLASFHIPEHDPTHPVLLGEPVDTVGNVPNTVAYSEKHKIACVANTGSKPGLQCYKYSECGKLIPVGGLRPLPVKGQTVPPVGPPNTVSNVLFNPSETAVFVVIKGDGVEDGFVYAYKIVDGEVSEKPVKSRLEGVPTAFGASFVDDSTAVVSTPAFGAAFVSISEDFKVSVSTNITVENQGATCWTAFNPESGNVYLLDGGVADVTILDPTTESIGSVIPGFEAGMGNFDGLIAGSFLYALQSEPAIAIFDLDDRETPAQPFDLSGLGDRASFIGMAYYAA